jgi:hypothetical protein
MVATMTCSRGAIAAVVDHVGGLGASRAARVHARRWGRVEPVLAGFDSPAQVAVACRAARGVEQDRLLSALLALSPGDVWAPLTVVAGLADRLAWVVTRWARAGIPMSVLADAEAELVAACWAAVAACDGVPPDRPGLALVDRAWETVRTGRRRARHHDDRTTVLPVDIPAAAVSGRPVLELLAAAVTDAVVAGRLTVPAARAVYLTRVSGLSTVEAGRVLGCGAGALRVVRSRAEHRLAA